MTSKRNIKRDTLVNRKKDIEEILEDILKIYGWKRKKIEKIDEIKQYINDHLNNYGKMIICRLDYCFKHMLPAEYANRLGDTELEIKLIDEFVIYFFTLDFADSPLPMELEDILKLMKKAKK